jgi:hypothetical protein
VILLKLNFPQVSWVRYRDVSLIAVGKFVYISDDRFRVMHETNADDWFLVIKSVSYKDEGIYECQVNSEPYQTYKYSLSVVGKSCCTCFVKRLKLYADQSVQAITIIIQLSILKNIHCKPLYVLSFGYCNQMIPFDQVPNSQHLGTLYQYYIYLLLLSFSYHYVITFHLSQSDHIKQLPLYFKFTFIDIYQI